MVFGGIAGILPPEHGEVEEQGNLPSINTSREAGDLQDMYRRTLAASWTTQNDELLPDILVEDIFAGGRGYRPARSGRAAADTDYDDNSISDTASRTTVQEGRLSTSVPEKRPKSSLSSRSRSDMRGDTLAESSSLSGSTISSGKGSLESSFQDAKEKTTWRSTRSAHEVSEFEVREDLRTWEITVND
jgi:hypothetical protein